MASGGRHALEYLARARPAMLQACRHGRGVHLGPQRTHLSLPTLATQSRSTKTKLPPMRTTLRG